MRRRPGPKIIDALASEGVAEIAQLQDEIFLLETLMDNVPDSIYFKDRQSRFTRINLYAAARFGVADPALAVGRTDFDFFADEHAAQALRDEQEIIRTGQPLVNVEEKETRADGDVRWVSTTKLPLRDRLGNIIGTFGISRDITARKQVEEQLQRQAFYDPLTGSPEPRAVPRPAPASVSPRQPRARQAAVRACCTSISIASRRSTTASDTRPATIC